MLQPQTMPPCCIVMAGAGQDIVPLWLDQELDEEDDDQDELLALLLALAKEMAEPFAAAS